MPRLRQRPERKRNSDSEYGLSDYEQDNDDEEYCESEYKNEVESDSDEDVESDVGDDVEGGAESTEMSEVEEIELPIRVSTPKKAVKPKAKAEPKPEEVPSNVNRHIQTMPPEILRGVYAVIPSPRPKRGLDQSLPPIHKIEDIFDDLVSKAESHGFEKFIKRIGDRKLRVATMCSGTEAPLLALDMIAESFKRLFGKSFRMHHLFSAEIEPFKQSYIQRNFNPDILFRDVSELVNDRATTAFGSIRKVPVDPDLLVAGFSCVDFSQLNSHKKSLDQMGESGHTFFPILQYVKRCRPPLIILENVFGAPWGKITEIYKKIGYHAYHASIDTKNFYLPQTRERGYLLCIDQNKFQTEPSVGKGGKNSLFARTMKNFERPASSPITNFLLKHDDPRLRIAINDISVQAAKERQAVDWTRYKARHLAYRMENGLGDKRPLTRWQDNGTCQVPDFYWHGWARAQTERVWDTLDVNFLRSIIRRSDFMSKCRVIDLSQGLDRELDQRASGIAGCLTPRGQHFISTRGGPLLGVEALALQGIPIDRLLLNNESQKDLHDLAGNAMSSPVVGAAILTALILGHKALLPGPPASNEPERQEAVSLPSSVTKPYPMQDIPVEISTLDSVPAKDLLVNAQRSCRLCLCEGQSGTRRKNVLKCSKCNHTACVKCGRNPSHVYEPIPAETLASRIAPIDFEALVKTGLPMRLQLMGLSHKDFEQFRGSWKSEHVNAAWKAYMDAVKDALDEELRFSDVSRQRAWAVTYEGAQSLLKLICSSTSMVWHLYVLPDKSEPSNSPLRQILAHPVARMTPSASLFSGTWQIGAPISSECSLTLSGSGNRVDSLGARVGLTDEDFRDRKVWSHLSVQGSDKEISHLDLDVRGKYELLQDCGGPLGSLHKKETSSGEQIYLFIDPTEFGPDQFDSWVFATEHDRLDIGQTREVIAQLQPNWNAFELGKEPKSVKCWYREWAKSPDVSLGVYLPSAAATYHILDRNALSKFCRFDCSEAYAPIFNCTVPATSDELTREPGVWERAELMESPVLLQKFAWLLQKAISVTQFSDWITVNPRKMASGLECALCAPPKPRLTWTRNEKDRVCAYEHPEDAAAYERSVKNRPAPFLGFVSRDENSNLQFRICLNMITLLHQALGNLPRLSLTPTLQWRLCIDATGFVRQRLPKLIESNNKNGAESSQPPGFKHFPLRPEQLRSLKWMREQESAKVLPFEEEEVVEALLPVINWRAEGRASSKRVVKGGILGDDVGYGKTAISLGLLDTQFENDSKSVPLIADGAIPVKATLIVVPHHLFDQWLREIRKFLVSKYRVLQIKTLLALKTLTIGEVEKVDIVLASASIFRGNNYYELMRLFAAAPEVPQGDGRIFDEWFRDAINGMKKHITLLRADGAQIDVPTSIRTKNERLREEADLSKYNPSKRLKGQKLQDHLAKKGKSSAKTTDEEPDADDRKSDNSQESKQNGTAGGTKTSKRKRLASDEEDYSGDYESDPVVKPKSRAARQPKKVKATKTVTVAADTKMAEATYHFQDAKHDWKRMRNPLVHMFDFTRVIIDEFTYSKERSYTAVLSVPARSKWILSGTPPLNDFADVKSFSPFLGINLGIDEDDVKRTDNERLKTIQRDRTEVEQFQPFITRRSAAWHRRRHEMAQNFLDRFMRKNVPEIGEIPFTEHVCEVVLAPAERALYIELFVQVMSQNLRMRRQGRGLYDAAEVSRLNDIISGCDSPEEALVKRCSLFSTDDILDDYDDFVSSGDEEQEGTAPRRKLGTGNTILDIRYKELKDLGADLQTKFRQGFWLRARIDPEIKTHFDKTLKLIESSNAAGELGDNLVRRMLRKCLDFAKSHAKKRDGEHFYVTAQMRRQNPKDIRPEFPATEKLRLQDLNNCNDGIRRLIAETRTRARASRIFQAIRYFQTSAQDAPYHCHWCFSIINDRNLVYLLGECGHTVCGKCLEIRRLKGECGCDGCTATLEGYRVVEGGDFAEDASRKVDDSWANCGGSKISEVINLLQDKSRIPEDDQVLLFIQFTELITAVSTALEAAGIKYMTVTSNDRTVGRALADFQNGTEEVKSKVLVLALGDVTASGLNLQNANHVIFFHPLVARSQYDYESGMSQAIGRSRRYGQLKHVHIYHFMALKTIEVNIFERRRRECVVKRDDRFVSVPKDQVKDSDAADWRGYPLEGSNAAPFDDGIDEEE